MGTINTIPSAVIITGRAYVRLVEAAQLNHALTDVTWNTTGSSV
jgi:hypothetical protein